MSSRWLGSTETVGVSTKRFSSASNSSRCELAKDKRLSRFNVVGGIQDPPSNCRARACGHNKTNRSDKSYSTYESGRPNTNPAHLHAYGDFQKLRPAPCVQFKRFGASCY